MSGASGSEPATAVQAARGDDDDLGPLERRILDFESTGTAGAGAKAAAVRSEFGVTLARYHQMLSAVIDSPTALRHDPILIRRLRRMRDARTAARASRTFRLDTQDDND